MFKSKNLAVFIVGLLLAVALTACGDSTATPNAVPANSVSTTSVTATKASSTTVAMTSPAMTTAIAATTVVATPPGVTTAMAIPTTTVAMTTAMAAMTTAAGTMMPGMTMMPGTTMAAMTTSAAGATSAAAGTSVTIQDFKFGPDTLNIAVGTTVTWTNKDSSGHTVTSDDGTILKSDLIPQNGTFSYTFTKPGTYTYHCEPHPFMKATIIVK